MWTSRHVRTKRSFHHGQSPEGVGRELLVLALVLATLGAIAVTAVAAYHDLTDVKPVAMPKPEEHTRRLTRPLAVLIAVDDSDSMLTSDPGNQRWDDVGVLGDWMHRYERPTDRLGLIRFDYRAETSRWIAANGIRTVSTFGTRYGRGTRFLPVAERADEMFAKVPKARKVLIVVTDGAASDAPRALRRFRHSADAVYLVALDRGSSWDDARRWWEGKVTAVSQAGDRRPRRIAAELARDLLHETGEKEAG